MYLDYVIPSQDWVDGGPKLRLGAVKAVCGKAGSGGVNHARNLTFPVNVAKGEDTFGPPSWMGE